MWARMWAQFAYIAHIDAPTYDCRTLVIDETP
jgi:hypothetical protein